MFDLILDRRGCKDREECYRDTRKYNRKWEDNAKYRFLWLDWWFNDVHPLEFLYFSPQNDISNPYIETKLHLNAEELWLCVSGSTWPLPPFSSATFYAHLVLVKWSLWKTRNRNICTQQMSELFLHFHFPYVLWSDLSVFKTVSIFWTLLGCRIQHIKSLLFFS